MEMNTRPTTAFVLAAGLGTRMRPLTDALPKPLVPLAGRPLIDHVLDRLSAAGITRAIVNVHYRADAIEAHLAKRRAPAIEISDERGLLLDTGGGVARALPRLGAAPFLICNSDTVWIEGLSANLERLIAAWDQERMDTLMLLAATQQSLGYSGTGDFVMDAEGRLARKEKGRVAPFAFAGVSIAHPRLFADAPQGPFSLNTLWNRAIERDRLYGIRLDGRWMHVGDPQALAAAEAALAHEDQAALRPGARP